MKKLFILLSFLVFLPLLTSCEKELTQSEITQILKISNEQKGTIPINQNNKNTYYIKFNLENKSNYDLKIKGNVGITINEKKINETFTEMIYKSQELVIKVVFLHESNVKDFEINYINIIQATYND